MIKRKPHHLLLIAPTILIAILFDTDSAYSKNSSKPYTPSDIIVLDTNLPKIDMLLEPDYTGDIYNTLFWKPVQWESIPILPESIRIGVIKVVAINEISGDTSKTVWPTVWPDSNKNSVTVESLSVDSTYRYLSQLWIEKTNGETVHGSWSEPVFSTQDTTYPEVDNVEILEANSFHNGWYDKNEIHISFVATDTAGIDSVYLYYRMCCDTSWSLSACKGYYPPDTCNGSPCDTTEEPGLTLVQDIFTFSANQDTCYEFYIGAKDAAHAPESHEGNWILDGNKDEPGPSDAAHCSVKIDIHSPFSKVIADSLAPYQTTSAFKVWYSACDTPIAFHSGIDTVWLYYVDPKGDTVQDTQYIHTDFEDSSYVHGYFGFKADSGDGEYKFWTIAKDIAWNEEIPKLPEDSTYVDTEKPGLFGLTLEDTTAGCPADTGWTNDRCVWAIIDTVSDTLSGIDSLKIWGDVQQIETVFADTILIRLHEGEGLKTVYCQVSDSAGNWSDTLDATIMLDIHEPALNNINLFDYTDSSETITDEATVGVQVDASDLDAQPYYMALFEDPSLCPTDTNCLDTPWQSFKADTIFTFSDDSPGWKVLWCAVKDQAGNIDSCLLDSIELIPTPEIERLVLFDYDEEPRDSVYTNDQIVWLYIDVKGESITEYAASETLSKVRDDPDWLPFADSVKFELSDRETLKTVFCKVKNAAGDTSDIDSAEITLDMTCPVIINPLLLSDTTRFIPDTAVAGWTNDQWILACIKVEDNLSGLEHVVFDGDIDSVVEIKRDSVKVRLTDLNSRDTIYCTISDSAGNSISDTAYIQHDSINPTLFEVDIPLDTTAVREILVWVDSVTDEGDMDRIFRVRLSEDSSFAFDSITLNYTDSTTIDTLYQDSIPFTLSKGEGLKKVYGEIRDKAGNWSDSVYDLVWLTTKVRLDSIRIFDLTDTTDLCCAADPRWSDSLTVSVTIYYKGVLKKILLCENGDFSSPCSIYDTTGEWDSPSSNLAIVKYDLSKVGRDTLWCRIYGPNLTDSSDVKFDYINVDTTTPVLNTITLFDLEDIDNTSFTNERTIRVKIDAPLDSLSKMKFWETGFDTVCSLDFRSDITYTIQSPGNGEKAIHCAVRDSAGNWSSSKSNSIILDTIPPMLDDIILSDISTFGPSDSELTDNQLVEVTLVIHDSSPGKLCHIILAQDSGLVANRKVYLYPDSVDSIIGDTSTIYYPSDREYWLNEKIIKVCCVVKDSAGNFSRTLCDTILYTEPPVVSVKLYDRCDTTDTLFSGSDTVGVRIIREQGRIDSVCYSHVHDPDSCKYIPWPQEVNTLDTIYVCGCSLCVCTLYCSAKNNAGGVAEDTAYIIVDMKRPTLSKIQLYSLGGDSIGTDDRIIDVICYADDKPPGKLAKIKLSEDPNFSDPTTTKTFDIDNQCDINNQCKVQYELSDKEGQHIVYAYVLDCAENKSATLRDTITFVLKFTNYPNPFNPAVDGDTKLYFKLSDGTSTIDITICIYDVFGNLVRKWEAQAQQGFNDGKYSDRLTWNGTDDKNKPVANGVYICVIKAGDNTIRRKIALRK